MATYEPPPPKRLGEFLESAVPPPPLPWWCANCAVEVDDLVQTGGPRGLQWKCKRCLLAVHEPVHVFDPTVAPQGREESLLALAALTEMVYGLRRAEAEDLYAIVGPYFRAAWCVYDVHQALNGQPDGVPHPDNGWSDDLPYEWMLYHALYTRKRRYRR